jgi:hypothetical protein
LIRIEAGQNISKGFQKDRHYRYAAYRGNSLRQRQNISQFNSIMTSRLEPRWPIENAGDTVVIGDDKRCQCIEIGENIFLSFSIFLTLFDTVWFEDVTR